MDIFKNPVVRRTITIYILFRKFQGCAIFGNMTKKPTIVVKIGSALLANQELLTPRYGFLQRLLEDIAQLRAQGSNVILCSSGSVALGLRIIGETPESAGVSDKQAAAA